MARPSIPVAEPKMARLTPAQMQLGIERLKKCIDRLEQFAPTTVIDQFSAPELDGLEAAIDDALVQTFGLDTSDYKRYKPAADFYRGPFNARHPTPAHEIQQSIARSKLRSLALLREAVTALENRLAEAPIKAAAGEIGQRALGVRSRRVFVVHGHDEGARETVARFLEQIELEPIILHVQANQGRTIIEKVEAHGNVGFAVVILTPDDEGCEKGGTLQPRARQNVLLELGYFIGRLGRKHVCALKRGDIEIPSDFGGVVYENFDSSGGWKQALGRELQAIGYQIDWNKVMRQ